MDRFDIKDEVVLLKDYRFSWMKIRAGTLGVIVNGDGGLHPEHYWVNFPATTTPGGRCEGAWIRPEDLKHAELLEILSGGETDTSLTADELEEEMKWVRTQVKLARREKARVARQDRLRRQRRKERMAKKDAEVAAEMLHKKVAQTPGFISVGITAKGLIVYLDTKTFMTVNGEDGDKALPKTCGGHKVEYKLTSRPRPAGV